MENTPAKIIDSLHDLDGSLPSLTRNVSILGFLSAIHFDDV